MFDERRIEDKGVALCIERAEESIRVRAIRDRGRVKIEREKHQGRRESPKEERGLVLHDIFIGILV